MVQDTIAKLLDKPKGEDNNSRGAVHVVSTLSLCSFSMRFHLIIVARTHPSSHLPPQL